MSSGLSGSRSRRRSGSVFLLLLAAGLCSLSVRAENLIDVYVAQKAEAANSQVCDDAEFLRRASLDLTGVVPTVETARAFLADSNRPKLIEKLLASPEFNAWWGRFLMELSTGRRANKDDEHDGRALYAWFKESLQKNVSYKTIVHDLVTAKGTQEDSPATNFILRYKVRPSDVVGAVGRAFLGRSLQCAQCHDHPFDSLTQEQFWGAAAFLNRTRRYEVEDEDIAGITDLKNSKKMKKDADPQNDEEMEKPKIYAKPAWPEAKDAAHKGDREEMAAYLIADPLFPKNIVNRVWSKLMGKGFVERLDGFGSRAKPSHSELLEQLSADFVRSGYDLRSALRQIVNSKAYQYSARAGDGGPFNVPALRPLSSDQLFASIVQATKYGLDEDNSDDNADPKTEKPVEDPLADAPKMKKDQVADNTSGKEMAMKKPDAADPAADEADDGEEADNRPIDLFGPAPRTVRSSLTLLNHSEIHNAVESGARYIMKTLGKPVKAKHFEYAYLALLSRVPSAEEQKLLAGKRKRADLEDVLWALLNSVEFKNNH